MRKTSWHAASATIALAAICSGHAGVGRAGEVAVHVMLAGEVAPGVYGQVNIGNDRPPPLVYAQPMLIVPQSAPPPPIYLHVPPGHARNWRKHCHEYNACNRPVYFVRSAEYEPGYVARPRDHDDRDRRDVRDGDRDRGHAEREHEEHEERDHQRGDNREHGERDRDDHDHDHDHDH